MYDEIRLLFPDISSSQFTLRDDGNGPYLDSWNYPQQAPTQDEIDAATPLVLKAKAFARLNAEYEKYVNQITAGYPQHEIDSWPKQEEEARTWSADNSAQTPWLDAAALARGITKTSLVIKILYKAQLFAVIHGQLTGKRQKLEDQINALNSPTAQQLDAIQW